LADLTIQVEIGQRPPIPRFAFPDNGGFVAACAADVPIDAVDARVQRAADEPFRMRRLPVQHLRPGREPIELGGEFGPEAFGVAIGARVHRLVAHVGRRTNMRRGWKNPIFLQ
jgi:hypothetical protein